MEKKNGGEKVGRSLCYIGGPGSEKPDVLEVFKGAGLGITAISSTNFKVAGIEKDPPIAVLLGAEIEDRRSIVGALQERSSLRQIPVLSIIHKPDRDSVERAFTDGSDDFLLADAPAQVGAMAEVFKTASIPEISKAPNGLVLLAEENRFERIRLGRLLKRNGFDVHFAADLEELSKDLEQVEPRAVVASAALRGGSLSEVVVGTAEKIYEPPPWIIIKTDEAHEELAKLAAIKNPRPAVVFDKGQDAERLTFLMNEILTPPPPNVRRSQRLLYGTPILFRKEGLEEVFWGYSYNINLDGLFIRTLTPFTSQDKVDLSFTPPFGRGKIEVTGEVRWRKELASSISSSSPVGMGVQFTRWTQADKAGYSAGYKLLLQEHKLVNPRLAFQDSSPSGEE